MYYIFCVIALIVGVIVLKKVAGCLIKSVILILVLAALAVVYYMYFK